MTCRPSSSSVRRLFIDRASGQVEALMPLPLCTDRHATCLRKDSPSHRGRRMKRHVRAASIFVLALALSSAAGADEQAESVPARSFTALQPLLIPGERLIVRDNSGRKTHGRFVSLSGYELEIKRRRWNFRTERRTWTEGTVERIQHEDSRWEGGAIGAAVGLAVAVILAR